MVCYDLAVIKCASCGDLFHTRRKDQRFCSIPCANRDRALNRVDVGPCADCGADQDVTGRGLRLCALCRKIRRKARQDRWAAKNPDKLAQHYVIKARRRRAIKLGLPAEKYTLAEIAERDGRVCQLCDDPVDMLLSGLDTWGPTIDHVIPISKGGPDTRENVQLAHRRCNEIKGARILR